MSATLRLSRVHYPVTALGPGRRLGIWVQGCSLGCHGCLSRDTWSTEGGQAVCVDDLLNQLAPLAGDLDGVTISGGEPFEQAQGLGELLRGLAERFPEADLLCYSGLPLRRLEREHANVLAALDAVIPEPFVQQRPDGGKWRGSDNQPLVLLTDRARARFSPVDGPPHPLQVAEADGGLFLIGVPRRGDLAQLETDLIARGVTMEGCSWR